MIINVNDHNETQLLYITQSLNLIFNHLLLKIQSLILNLNHLKNHSKNINKNINTNYITTVK